MFENAIGMYTVKRVNSLLLRPSISHPGVRQADIMYFYLRTVMHLNCLIQLVFPI